MRFLRANWLVTLTGLFIILVVIGLLAPNSELPIQLVLAFGAGWALVLGRFFTVMTMDWEAAATGLVAVVGLFIGLHVFFRWLFGQIHRAGLVVGSDRRVWRMRWTVGVLSLVILMFIAGIAAIGMTHQTVWLFTSKEPITHGSSRDWRIEANTSNNLSAMGKTVHRIHDEQKAFPAGGVFDKTGCGLHGWQTALLPYLYDDVNYKGLYNQIKLDLPWHDPANAPHFKNRIPTYLCIDIDQTRDADGFALSHYASNVRVMGGGPALRMPQDFPDGESNTILLGEAAGNFRPWGHHANWRDPALGINTSPDGFGHPGRSGGAHVAFADASVRFLGNNISPSVLEALSTPSGGELLPKHWGQD